MAQPLQPLLLFFFCCFFAVATATTRGHLHYIPAKLDAACASTTGTTPAASTHRVLLSLYHRQGPCSPSPVALRLDELRAAAYLQDERQPSSEDRVPTVLGSALGTLEYVVSVGIGSPPLWLTLILHTGSDLSWVRCNGRDPRASGFYTPFSCSSDECSALGEQGNGCSDDGQCQYKVRYLDGTYTTGTFSSDMLALTDSGAITGFQFGCSELDSLDHRLDGLLGFGGGVQSLPSQTAAIYGSHFSYCLPPTPASSGFVTLGAPDDDEYRSSFITSPMFRITKHPTFYFVLLLGITVAEKPLDLPPSVFAGGSMLDSGTVITRLPTTAYAALSSAFRDEMKEYPPGQPNGLLDTCFDFTGHDGVVMIPRVALVFDGVVVVELAANGIMVDSCLAFAATSTTWGIVGNVQQRTFEVLYDVGQMVVGFRAAAC